MLSESERTAIDQYKALFGDPKNLEPALKTAMEERKLEIDMYWKRAAYFWTLIGASFVGFFSANQIIGRHSAVPFLIACLGVAFSFSWYLVNRGSKRWQENWERHVELLEEATYGPLHRITLDAGEYRLRHLHRAYGFSVTRVNQLLSALVVCFWTILAVGAAIGAGFGTAWGDPTPGIVAVLVALFIATALRSGKSESGPRVVRLTERELGHFQIGRPNQPLQPSSAEDASKLAKDER